ncbi:MAG: peptidylprolyl isomerase [Bacteroidales bacterium]|nr:peptidylprolyl isomerase [Bacteroidales bacterium]
MRHRIIQITILTFFNCAYSQQKSNELYIIKTEFGNITFKLYDETPLHKENMIKLINQGFYKDLLFHRVIQNFMIQGGDPDSKNAPSDKVLGNGGLNYTIPAEFNINCIHKKGALAAARKGDQVNPLKESSSCQFYIVQGKVYTLPELNLLSKQMNTQFNDNQVKTYTTIGGVPYLDYNYTVFGEVVEGLAVVDKIAAQQVNNAKRPLKNITFTIEKLKN